MKQSPDYPLICVDKEPFTIAPKPKKNCTVIEFCQNNEIQAVEHNVFLEVRKFAEERQPCDIILDVILENKVCA